MIAELELYPRMKGSGVRWLEEVPEHWEVRRLASCLRSIETGSREQGDAGSAAGVPSLGGEHVGTDGQFLLSNMRYVSRAYFLSLRKGVIRERDVLLVKDGATIGKVALVRSLPNPECAVNEHVFIMRTADLCLPGFLYQHIRSRGIQEAIWQQVTGSAQPGLSSSFTKGTWLCLPPLPEQTAIVRFLDHVDRRIRRYIRAKQKLIKLLEEQKQAIIHRAVTRGLDPTNSPGANLNAGRQAGGPKGEGRESPSSVRLKPSGVEWLGDVPEHWEVRRNGRLFSQRNETGFAELPILEVSLRTGVRVRDFENSDRKQAMADRDKYKRAVAGDIAYNMMRMWQGAVGITPTDGLISPAYVVARPRPGVDSRYYIHLFKTAAYMAEVDKFSHGIVKDRNRLYWEDFKRMSSSYPPPREQIEIADAIHVKCGEIDESTHRIRQEITLLREYRTRLIADVVTGKLDVREAAANLPGEVPETLEDTELPGTGEEDIVESPLDAEILEAAAE